MSVTAELNPVVDRKAQRIAQLLAEDPQFAAAMPDADVIARKTQPGLSMSQIVEIVMEGYADRPALGSRARELATDPATGRSRLRLLPRFDTVSYREMWERARAAAADWHHSSDGPVRAGDFVCILGFTSPNYATILIANIHRGAVNVPLQTSAPPDQHAAIIAETSPRIVATGIEYVDAAVDAILLGQAPDRLVVFDYDPRDDDQREVFEAARERLAAAGCATAIDDFEAVIARGRALEQPETHVPPAGEDRLAWLFYTSGSTGTPKGAVFTESLSNGTWLSNMGSPVITLSFMPMSHLVGNGYLIMALANGGTSFCSPKSDLSTMLEDFALARPTQCSLVPRVVELFYQHYLGEIARRQAAGGDPKTCETEVKRDIRERILGGRLLSVGCGSASLAPETYEFLEAMLEMHVPIGYSATELAGGTALVDWKIQRPPIIDYRLLDVPELGYFTTDKPYPRGELLVKAERFMGGYYKRPELTAEKFDEDGFYHTGDVMAEHGPDHLVFVDRCNNVIKLSQGEFVAISRLEALYVHSPSIHQIYLYGSAERAFLLAVVVPSEELAAELGQPGGQEHVRTAIRRAFEEVASEQRLNSYEVPRDFIVEPEPFSLANGLLSEIGKHQRPKLKDRYQDQLEALYAKLAKDQVERLQALRLGGAGRSAIETVQEAVRATLGVDEGDVRPGARFSELGGDSLSALTCSLLLEEIFGVEVPVGMIVNPAGNLQQIADFVESARSGSRQMATFASVHGAGTTTIEASELTLDKFLDADLLADAPSLPQLRPEIQTVLMTGATGFLGRFQALAWLEHFAARGSGKVICLARGADQAAAQARIEATFDTDPKLIAHFRALAADHLEVVAGDVALPDLGLDRDTWSRLAETVDLIAHPAAHVNHVLPYNQLFAANVAGTAELIRLALTTRLKRFNYVSTMGINSLGRSLVDEDSDVRTALPSAQLNDHYANGYGASKWAGEVLLREAFELAGLPVAVFRPGMILAHSTYAAQLNVPDMFTRLIYSLVTLGIAPGSFYASHANGERPRARYDGTPVDSLAQAITAIGLRDLPGFQSYNLAGGGESDVSLDTFVDWLIAEGCPIDRIASYDEWFSRFESGLRAMPDEQKQHSMVAILEPYRQPQHAATTSAMRSERFQRAASAAGAEIGPVAPELIRKYLSDLRQLELL